MAVEAVALRSDSRPYCSRRNQGDHYIFLDRGARDLRSRGVSLLLRVWRATEADQYNAGSAEPGDRNSIAFAYLTTLMMTLGTNRRSVWMELVLLSIGTASGMAFLGLSGHA